MPQTVAELTKALSFSVNNLESINDPKALSIVKDEILAFSELLGFGKGTFNGVLNQEVSVNVNPGDVLPVLYQPIVVDVHNTETGESTRVQIRVTEIRSLQWTEDGGVMVNLLGTVQPYVEPQAEEGKQVPADVIVEEPKAKKPARKSKKK